MISSTSKSSRSSSESLSLPFDLFLPLLSMAFMKTLVLLSLLFFMSARNRFFFILSSFAACDSVKYNATNGCAPGHDQNASELCSQCSKNYASLTRHDGPCLECPDAGGTAGLFILAVLLAVGLFSFLIWDNLEVCFFFRLVSAKFFLQKTLLTN